jgi:4-carboxymuconolactone decarboxylase
VSHDYEDPTTAGESPAIREIMQVYASIPELRRLREDVLLGDVWGQKEITPKERSMITCAILAASGRNDELISHVQRAVANGVTPDQLRGMAVHLCFYAGWPAGLSLGRAALPFISEDAAS